MATAQGSIPVIATVLSTIGTVFWCIQLLPQIYHLYRRKNTAGVPASMMLLWSVSSVPFGAYDEILHFAVPLVVQPQIFGTLGLIVWAQCMYYGHGWSFKAATGAGIILWAICGGLEALLILTLRPVYERGVEWPVTLLGVIAAVMLTAGFIPVWLEIIRRRGRVVGLSTSETHGSRSQEDKGVLTRWTDFVFLAIDWMGAFFSLMGVVTQGQFDILGGVLYITCAVTELAIFVSQGIFLVRTHQLRKQAKSMGINFDDLPEAKRYQWPRYTDDEEAQPTENGHVVESKTEPNALQAEDGRSGEGQTEKGASI